MSAFSPTRKQKRAARNKAMRGGRFFRMDGSATKASFDFTARKARNKAARAARKRNR